LKYLSLMLFVLAFSAVVHSQEIKIKSLEVYPGGDRLSLPVITSDNKLIIEFDVQSDFEPTLNIVFRFCDYGWTPTKNIFLLNQNRNQFLLFNFYRLPVTVEDAEYHFKGSFPDKDDFIEFPFSGKWRFYITDQQDTSIVYAQGRFYYIESKVELSPRLKQDQLENKTYWPVELSKVFNITTDFILPEDFYPGYVDRIEIVENQKNYYPVVINRNDNALERQFKWDANRTFTYIARDIVAGNEYRQVDLRDINYYTTKNAKAQRDGLEFSRFYLNANPDLNGAKIYTNYKDPFATYLDVTFSIRPPDDVYGSIFIVGAFNNWKLSTEYQLKEDAGIYSITLPLKRGIYDYQYVVADVVDGEIKNADWVILEGNTWKNSKVYDIFLYYNEPNDGGYERIIGYSRIPGKNR